MKHIGWLAIDVAMPSLVHQSNAHEPSHYIVPDKLGRRLSGRWWHRAGQWHCLGCSDRTIERFFVIRERQVAGISVCRTQ